MKTTLLIATISTIISTSTAQTSVKSESFSRINIQGNAKVRLVRDSTSSVTFSSNENLKMADTEIKNGTLYINGIAGNEMTVTMPKLEEINIGGSGSVSGESKFKMESLKLKIDGNGKINLDVEADRIDATVPGIGKINLTGTAQEANFDISGSGKVDALGMRTIKSSSKISGIGKVNIDVIDELNVDISGSGSVNYKTTPKKVNENITGTGKIGAPEEANEGVSWKNDTTRFELGKNQILVIGKKDSTHAKTKKAKPIWAGFELGLNSYLDNGGSFTLSDSKEVWDLRVEKSVSVALNLIQKNIELGNSNVWLFTGLGVTWNNYRFSNDVVLLNGSVTTAMHDTTSGIRHIKSKLVASYLTAPVMLEVFTSRNKKKAFHIGAGAMLGFRLGSHTKQKIEIDGDGSKIKNHDDFNLNPFRYGFRVAIGYGKFNVFADYYASTLFKNNKGPVLYPVNAGITMVGF